MKSKIKEVFLSWQQAIGVCVFFAHVALFFCNKEDDDVWC